MVEEQVGLVRDDGVLRGAAHRSVVVKVPRVCEAEKTLKKNKWLGNVSMPTQDVAVFFGEHEINQIKATVGNAELGSGSGCRLREFIQNLRLD